MFRSVLTRVVRVRWRAAIAGCAVILFASVAMGDTRGLDGLVRTCHAANTGSRADLFTSEDFDALCIEQVATYGSAARPYAPVILSRFVESRNGRDRALGAAFLGYVGYAPAEPHLVALLNDPDWRVVYAAARSLGWLYAKEAIPALSKVADSYWLPEVRDEARAAVASMQPGSARLARPEIRLGRFPPGFGLEVDAMFAPDVAPCESGQWKYRDVFFSEPKQKSMNVWISAHDALPAGELSGTDNGEWGGGLFWRQSWHVTKKSLYAINVAGIEPSGDGAVASFGEVGPYRSYQKIPTPPGEESISISNGPSGYGFVLLATRDAAGEWHLTEIARLPRAADAISTIAPDLFAALVGGRVVVFSRQGILGLATCAP
jgi:hypothetical protein